MRRKPCLVSLLLFLQAGALVYGIGDVRSSREAGEPQGGFGKSVSGVRLGIRVVKNRFQEWESKDIKLVFENIAEEAVVLQSGLFELKIEGPGASYVVFPHPFRSSATTLFRRVRVLEPGRSTVVEVIGLRDDHGLWRLRPGTYRIRARYRVKRRGPQEPLPRGRLWLGQVESGTLEITVVPNSAMHNKLVALLAPLMYVGGRAKVRPEVERLGAEADRELLLWLRDRGVMHRLRAAWALGVRRVREAVPDLIGLLGPRLGHDRRGYEARAAVVALGDIGDRRAVEPLSKLMSRVKPWDSQGEVILKALRKIGDPAAIPLFRKHADSKDFRVAGQALAGLQAVAGEDVVTPLLNDILAKETPTRQQSHDRLKQMEEAAAPKLLEIYSASADLKRIAKAGTFLELTLQKGHYAEEIRDAALRKLDSDNPAIRRLAPYVLRSCKAADVAPALVKRLRDNEGRPRFEATMLLGQFKDRRAVEPLLEILRDHTRRTDEKAMGRLLGFRDPKINASVFAEFEKAGRNFRLRLIDIVGPQVAYGKSTPDARRWLETIAADDTLGELQVVARHYVQLMKNAAEKP